MHCNKNTYGLTNHTFLSTVDMQRNFCLSSGTSSILLIVYLFFFFTLVILPDCLLNFIYIKKTNYAIPNLQLQL